MTLKLTSHPAVAASTEQVIAALKKPIDDLKRLYAGLDPNKETFFNVGALNGQMYMMQVRIEQLERELAATRTAR